MADTFASVGLVQQAEVRNTRQLQTAAEARRAADEQRQLDAEQRLRDQQLAADLRQLDQKRLEDALQASRSGDVQARGSIVDLFA